MHSIKATQRYATQFATKKEGRDGAEGLDFEIVARRERVCQVKGEWGWGILIYFVVVQQQTVERINTVSNSLTP